MRSSSLAIDEFLSENNGKNTHFLIIVGTVIFLLLSILLCFIKIDVVESFQGRLIPEKKVKTVQSPQSGEIRKIFVSDGSFVKAGQPIALMDTTVANAELDKLSKQKMKQLISLERINSSLRNIPPDFSDYPKELAREETDLWTAEETNYNAQRDELKKQINLKKISIETARSSFDKIEAEYKNSSAQEALVRDGVGVAISEFSYMNYKSAKTKSAIDMKIQRSNLAQAAQELSLAEGKFSDLFTKRTEELVKQREQIIAEKSTVDLELIKSERKAVLMEIKSPEDGYVDKLKLTNVGQALGSSEIVATIVPKDQTLVMRAEASTKDIALISEGAPSHIKIDAYPYQLYGAIKGSIIWVSADSEEDTTTVGREKGGRHYLLESSLGEWELGTNDITLKPGMSATIDVTTQRKTILSIIFSPAIKNIDQAFRRL
ncbi:MULTISPECIES: HlyD family type I secretion periplasmic adaptor subunit [Pseudomonas syringae group]|uniref:Membrane fusion protein (MFP) family protein n=1 Tax=Pseudomonas syringae pv. ribicola TaxID=55398 RepID=A0A0Q0BHT9_PSESI|nr:MULTISPECIES: HlyD family type I secretion periplasmic adaptor subunit [Pseudomonas syringae group]EKN46106.1 HlyD family type I secretion membrane fusion protein [Pseudomonas viridiflava UASWS0038]KPL62837.1 hypothetical protein PVFL_20195 [Pseudomonas viridiflava]KPY46187.1 HlyD family type I secretion membrane fusion protein [Pseudomonas syringae pv. ribicola]KPZ26204.1 HlyD family type I secretion membrane fusion protein [Pseudomonas viridiflava]OAG89537.1 hypothetical protein AO065_124